MTYTDMKVHEGEGGMDEKNGKERLNDEMNDQMRWDDHLQEDDQHFLSLMLGGN